MIEYAGPRVDTRAGEARRDVAGFLRSLDWMLLATVVALVAYGLWAIDGITRHDVPGDSNYFVVRQLIFAVIGVAALVATVLVDPSLLRRHRRAIYAVLVSILVLVLLVA